MFDAAFRFSARAVSSRTMLAALAFAVVIANPVHADPLDRQLVKHAPDVLAYCQSKGYQNVGVLKFRVQKGQSALTDNVGP